MAQVFQSWHPVGVNYKMVALLNVFWRDLYRPEIYWRKFETTTDFDPKSEAVYIFQKVAAPNPASGK
jgi:hypothetical protein